MFINSLNNRHLLSLQFLVSGNKAALNIPVQFSGWEYVFMGHKAHVCLTLYGTADYILVPTSEKHIFSISQLNKF